MTRLSFFRYLSQRHAPNSATNRGIYRSSQLGLSLIEVLIIVAIIALLVLSLSFSIQMQFMRSRDAQRKADLEKLKIAFEHYFSDRGCYPPADIFFNGGTEPDPSICDRPLAALEPYLQKIPCDPETKQPYAYYPPEGKTSCDGYRLYTKLENGKDKGIEAVGCDATSCGAATSYNYGVSVGGSLVQQTGSDTPTGAPTVTPINNYNGSWVCSPNSDLGVNGGLPYCKEYTDPTSHGCGASYGSQGACSSNCFAGSWVICND